MKKNIINFFLWFSTPFVVVFFLILLVSNSIPAFSVITLLRLNIFLVLLPLFVYWSSGLYFGKDYHKREQISIVSLLSSMVYIFIIEIIKLDNWLIITYLVYFLAVLFYFVISFSKLNQYVLHVASSLIVMGIMMILIQKDFYFFIIIILLFSGLLMFLFVENKMDTVKNILLSYSVGFLSTLLFTLFVFLLDKINFLNLLH